MLELVIAMGMVAILAISLYASLNIAFKSSRAAEAAVEPGRTNALTMTLLGQDLQNAVAPPASATGTTTTTTGGAAAAASTAITLAGNFEGTQAQDDRGHEGDDINFYSTSDSPQHVDANGEIKQIEITVVTEATTGDHVLVRRVVRNLFTQLTPAPDEEILCRGVNSFTVTYFDGTNWLNTWDSTQEDNQDPVAVQVILELERKQPNGQSLFPRYTRVFNLSCSNAIEDANLASGTGI